MRLRKMKNQIRVKILVDLTSSDNRKVIEAAFKRCAQDYLTTNLEMIGEFEYKDFKDIKFVPYNYALIKKEVLGVDFGTIRSTTRQLRAKDGDLYDAVCLVIDESNWKMGEQEVWGWNLGEFFDGYQVQLIRDNPNEEYLYKTFAMELHHSLNDFVWKELGIDLSKFLGVNDYDEDVTHGRDPKWKAYEYRPSILKMEELLIRTFDKRNKRLLVQLYQTVIVLLRTLILKLQAKPSPILKDEIKNKHYHE